MSARRGWCLALVALAAAGTARADIVLNGSHHVGDCDDSGSGCSAFTPPDPVSRNQMFNYPINFTLTTTTTIDKVTLDNAVDLDGKLQIYLEARGTSLGSSSSRFGSLSGSTFDLIPDLVLGPGEYVIFPDGGCSESSGGTFFYNCPGGKINDFGYSSITLTTTQNQTALTLIQRRHLGDNADSDDDYDFTGTVSSSANEFYPDSADASDINLSFTTTANLRLTQIKFYRLRDINTESPTNATAAKVLVNGTQVGTLAGEGDPYTVTLGTAPLLQAGTAHTLRIESGSFSGQRDDFSWDEIVLVFASTTTSGTPGFFNAVDVGGGVLTGSVQTKVAGGAFTLDLYALNSFGTGQNTGYTGTATVEVLNAADNSGAVDVYGCRSTWSVAQTVPGTVTFVAGKALVSGTFLDAGLKEARIRVTDSTGAQGCSIDNFAIRPASFTVAPSQGSETTAGTTTALTNAAAVGLPRHRAGQPFTIVATARSATTAAATNYDGTPTASATALAPATTSGTVTLGTWGAVSNGARQTDTARYSEVGPVTITLKDTTWADVDADDTVASLREFSGSAATGRFVPDHFRVTEGSLAPSCAAGGFSYLGSTLAWATPAVTLTAESSDNTTTLNYQGALESLPATLGQPTYAALAGTLDTGALAAPVVGDATAGVATVTLPSLSFIRALIGAFDAEIRIDLPVFTDADGIAPAESPIVLGALGAGSGVAFTGNAKSQRFGRLYFEPRYGSDRLPLDVPLRAEYFDGVAFVHNAADACTVLSSADVTFTGIGGQTHALSAAGNGLWTVTLTAPNAPGQATLAIDLASPPVAPAVAYPLLQADSNGDGTYAEDPSGVATFGLFTQDQRWIYQREVVGN